MITIPITDDMIQEATKRAHKLGVLENSITKGDGNVAGYLGQIAVRTVWVGSEPETFDYNFDVVLPFSKLLVEVKTERSACPPGPDFYQKVCNMNSKQKCDYYAFAHTDFNNVWLCGYCSKERFLWESTFKRKGDIDSRRIKPFTFSQDCWVMEVQHLDKTIKEEMEFWK